MKLIYYINAIGIIMNQMNQIFSKNHFIIILILFLGCLLISAAAAAEASNDNSTDDSGIIMLDNSTEDILQESNDVYSFDELSSLINETPENEVLTLENDYTYINGSKTGIMISKPITIDGAGHTLDANKSSRIFNITASNVVLKNIKFINGNALGSYFTYYGGGAIYWNGSNGYLENCSFIDNSALGVDYDPYDREDEVIETENGMTMVVHHDIRPVGCTINQGGAITWSGENGTVTGCTFKHNHVAYPDDGGAIFWSGKSGKILNSRFYDNSAYRGSAIYWKGADGFIASSVFYNSGICDEGIFWTGLNGVIRNSILLGHGSVGVISPYAREVDADYNFWGDTVENPYKAKKVAGVNKWILLNLTSDKKLVLKNDTLTVSYDLNTLFDYYSEKSSQYDGLSNYSGQFKYVVNVTSLLKSLSFENNRINVNLSPIGFFDELADRINATPEGGLLILDRDYMYVNGSNKGIVISKPIVIDGNGHTLDGCKLSRMFNVTSDNVTLKNINFVNGNSFGRYFAIAGGGAIYWYGTNGLVENCNFINNTGSGIEDDPFDKEETWVDENGTVWYVYRQRPMGAKINEGGAIVWNGTDGIVSKCTFINNNVGYPNYGGAVCWRGYNGKIIDSEFYENGAWGGSAVAWIGDNGTISGSIVANSSFFDGGILWFGNNGTVINSILLSSGRSAFRQVDENDNVTVDCNYWGDTVENPNSAAKSANINSWLLMKFTHNGEFVKKGQEVLIKCEIGYLIDQAGNMVKYDGMLDKSFQFVYTAPEEGYLRIYLVNGNVRVDIDSKVKIQSKNLNTYYQDKISYKVTVSDFKCKVANKYVKFTIGKKTYSVRTDKNGVATLKLKLKPGKYAVYASYANAKVKNTINVKTTLVTKDLNVKAKKTGKFPAKVLSSKGKPLAKKTVKIKFKGKTYKIKTNKKGIATFKVSNKLKAGKYVIKTTWNGLTNSNRITVKK